MIRILLLAVAFAVIAPFFIKGPDGKPLMTLDKWFSKSPAQKSPEAAKPHKRTIYKWHDKDGWHFSTERPEGVANLQTIEVDGRINIMPSITASPKSSAPSSDGGVASRMKQAITAATHLQETIDKRKAAIDSATGQAGK